MLIASAKYASSIEAELARRGIALKRTSEGFAGPCPRCGGTDRFSVNTRKQIFFCRGCGGKGDLVDLVQFLDGVTIHEAIAILIGDEPVRGAADRRMFSDAPLSDDREKAKIGNGGDEQKKLEAAHRIWQEAVAIKNTAGEHYFARRGITLGDAPNYGGLRWCRRCPWENGTAPCVVARFTDAVTGEARGIWRRAIDGRKPKSLGPTRGCVIRLWPDEDVTTGLVIGEGVETTLAAATRFVCDGTLLQPAWAATSAGNLENLPILPGIDALTIVADNDENERGQDAARQCAARWAKAGREVVVYPYSVTGGDFNDAVRQ
jgi:phage/plasmid primase-like uncharacterized protein